MLSCPHRMAVLLAVCLAVAAPAARASSLQVVLGEAGEPASGTFFNDNDANDADPTVGIYRFDGALDIGRYTVTRLRAFGNTGSGSGRLQVSFDAFTNASGASGLIGEALDNGYLISNGLPAGSLFSKPVKQELFSVIPFPGAAPTALDFSSWVNPSNDPGLREDLVAAQSANAGDYGGVGPNRTLSIVNSSPSLFEEGAPFALVQDISIDTAGPTEFFARFTTQVVPLPPMLPAFALCLAGLALGRRRGRSA